MTRWCRPVDPEHGPQCRLLGPEAKEALGWESDPPGEYEAVHGLAEIIGPSLVAFELDLAYWRAHPRPEPKPSTADLLLEADLDVEEARQAVHTAKARLRTALDSQRLAYEENGLEPPRRRRQRDDEDFDEIETGVAEPGVERIEKAILQAIDSGQPRTGCPGLSENQLAMAAGVSRKGPFQKALSRLCLGDARQLERLGGPHGGNYYRRRPPS